MDDKVDGKFVAGTDGEKVVADILSNLNVIRGSYKIFNNIVIPSKSSTLTQIDHLILSRYGIFVIETKNYSGVVSCSESSEYWPVKYSSGAQYSLYNPLRQNFAHKAIVRDLISSFIPKHKVICVVFDYVCFTGTAELNGAETLEKVTTKELILSRILQKDKFILTAKELKPVDLLFSSYANYAEEAQDVHLQHVQKVLEAKENSRGL